MDKGKPWYECEQCYPLAVVCGWYGLNGGGRPTHLSTVLRHVQLGAVGLDGQRVKLAAVRCGNRWMTSRERFASFMAALTPAENLRGTRSEASPVPHATTSQRRRASETTEAELQRLGCT